jgi:hypothetical protein
VKGIGSFVLLLLVALGVTMYVTTRSPSRDLDAREEAWVEKFSTWRAGWARRVDRAEVTIGVTHKELGARRSEPLRGCTASLASLGEPPALLQRVVEHARVACAEVAYALSVNQRFGTPAAATTKVHLHRAGTRLALANRILHQQLESGAS